MFSLRHSMVALFACLPLAIAQAQAHADSSRQQVLDELAQARSNGDIVVPGELGGSARERFPALFPVPPTQATALTREAVRAELLAALQRGEVPRGDVDLAAGRAPAIDAAARDVAQGRTRAQVRTELAQATLRGDVEEAGDGGRLLRDIHAGRYGAAGHGGTASADYAMADAR